MSDDKILDEIREQFSFAQGAWEDVYRKGDADMRFVAGDPWDPSERKLREMMGRPCLVVDELSQYVNQRINDIRQNKRAIKLGPAGDGADDKTAELQANLIRTIEYKGGLQAYITGYENTIQRSFGFWGVGKRYVEDDSFDMELYIRSFPNPRTVYIDPDSKEPAGADMQFACVLEDVPIPQFKKRFPKAEKSDFSGDVSTQYPSWVRSNSTQVCEYWRIVSKKAKLLLVGNASAPERVWADMLPEGTYLGEGGLVLTNGKVSPILRERFSDRKKVECYISSALEVLEKIDWEGKYIPIVACFGRQYYLTNGGKTERIIESLIRKSEGAAMMHNYIMTAKMEMIGQVLKAPYIGYEGQFVGHEQEWANANRKPTPFLQVKALLDATGNAVLPLPQRNFNNPEIQSYEIADESAKRAIQNGMGAYAANAVRSDAVGKSGRALEKQEMQADQGSYHFVDSLDSSIQHTGRILVDMIPYVYDTMRDVLLNKPDESQETVRINEPSIDPLNPIKNNMVKGRYEVTVGVGPSYQSQRDMASEFIDILVRNLSTLPLDPQTQAKILSLSIKLKQLGPIGERMADLVDPEKKIDEQSAMALKAKADQMMQVMQQQTEVINQLKDQLDSKQAEIQAKAQIEQEKIAAQAQLEQQKLEAQLQIEVMKAKSQQEIEAAKRETQLQIESMKVEAELRIAAVKAEAEAKQLEVKNQMAQLELAMQAMKDQTEAQREEKTMNLQAVLDAVAAQGSEGQEIKTALAEVMDEVRALVSKPRGRKVVKSVERDAKGLIKAISEEELES